MATQRASLYTFFARVGLTVAVAFGLGRVFADGSWPLAAICAAVLPHGIIAFGERRRWRAPVQLLALIATAIVFTVYVVEVATLRGILPTGDTVQAYRDHFGNGLNELRTAIVPVPPTGSALLLSLLAIFVAGAVAEWSGRRLDVTTGAVAPSLVLFVAFAALGDGAWAVVTAVYALAIAAYFMTLQLSDLTDRRSWFHSGHARRSRVAAGGSVAAIAIVLGATVLGPLWPGARSEAWFDYRSLGEGDGGSIISVTTPILSIKKKLLEDPEATVMTVNSPRGLYWRVAGLDYYTYDEDSGGEIWTLPDETPSDDDIPRPREPFLRNAEQVRQHYRIERADAKWIPAAYRAESVDYPGRKVIADSVSFIVDDPEDLEQVEYDVVSRVPAAEDAPALEQQLLAVDAEYGSDFDLERYTELPDDVSAEILNLADTITADADGPYEAALAIRNYLKEQPDVFTYSTDPSGESLDTLEEFLFEEQKGYCEQYATAFGVLARAAGLPTRLATGYTKGEQVAPGQWLVRNKNAHAWNEVYFEDFGWILFDATPSTGGDFDGDAPGNAEGNGEATPSTTSSTTPLTTPGGSVAPGSLPPTTPPPDVVPSGTDTPTGGGESTAGRIFRSALLFFGTLLIVAAAILGALFFYAWRRKWHRRHAPDTRDRVLGAWRQALDYLAEAGIDPRPWATANEFALRYAPAHGAGDAGPALVYLARLQTAALFSPDEPSDAEAEEAWQHADSVDHAMSSRVPFMRKLRWRLDPRRGT